MDLRGMLCAFVCFETWVRYYRLNPDSTVADLSGQGNKDERFWAVRGDELTFYDGAHRLTAALKVCAGQADSALTECVRYEGTSVYGPALRCICAQNRLPFLEHAFAAAPAVEQGIRAGQIAVGAHCVGQPAVKLRENARLSIGDYCSFADSAVIDFSGDSGLSLYPFTQPAWGGSPQSARPEPAEIRVGSDVRAEDGVRLLPGARIGDGVLLKAGAVVSGEIPDYAIVEGAPGRVTGRRFPADEAEKLKKLAWWRWPEETVAGFFREKAGEEPQALLDYAEGLPPEALRPGILDFAVSVRNAGGTVFREEELLADGKRKILLVSHELENGGATIALMRMALAIQSMNLSPVVMSGVDGPMREILTGQGIAVAVCGAFLEKRVAARHADCFDAVFVNTLVRSDLINQLSGLPTRVFWWIHEAADAYEVYPASVKAMPQKPADNICVLAAGQKAKELIVQHRPLYQPIELKIYVPEASREAAPPPDLSAFGLSAEGKMIFADIGALYHRKGQDLLCQAIRMLPEALRARCLFLFVGTVIDGQYLSMVQELEAQYPDNVRYIGALPADKMTGLYRMIDCEICSSRHETGPFVVIEAWQQEALVIVSDNTGVTEAARQYQAGVVFENDSAVSLCESIQTMFALSPEQAGQMRARGLTAYDEVFSRNAFVRNLSALFAAAGISF